MTFNRHICSAVALLLAAGAAQAQSTDPLRRTVEQAVNGNPEVTARFNAYRASVDAVDVARAGFLPKLDLTANAGRDSDRITTRSPETQNLNRREAGLTLSQVLWDGLGTRNDVDRAGHERLARYFELLDVTEQTALEAARAHFDVQRYRRLVQLAEDNYVQHRYAYLQIQSRFKAGVGRGVDLEQAGARVALAESNLSTEVANLHDVTARYQRVVGVAPPKDLPAITLLKSGVPASPMEAMNTAVRQSAAVSASIEGLRSARASVDGRKSLYQPRVEARVRGTAGRNVDAIADRTRDTSAELVLSWNLYNGGADQARVRQQTNLLSQSADLRDKACRDTRQTTAIAYNDTRKLVDQLVYLDRNTLAIEKARDAYRQQFDIGQRSLLDLLNAENELYTARRSYANAEYDLGFAYARTQAAMYQLNSSLGVSRVDNAANDAAGWEQGDDAPTRCPVIVAEVIATDHSELDARAQRLAETAPPVPPARPAAPVQTGPLLPSTPASTPASPPARKP
jgi:adhesin transport system outer membrane protein